MDQSRIPFFEALQGYVNQQFIPFHTPGHKMGKGASPTLQSMMGESLAYDLGLMYAVDDLHEPQNVLKEAQMLAAELYGADVSWFSINGTTALIEAMIMATVQEGDEILLPREAHRSVISGLVMSGALPVYMDCEVDEEWGIPLGVTPAAFEKMIKAHPKAKAVLFVYPNYYGVTAPLKELIAIAHQHNLTVLVDEAHGAHLPFSDELPPSALSCGADLVAQSTHKLVGSLTQTSMLHGQGKRFSRRKVTQAHQMLQSTSPNYLLLASLDIARQQLAMEGRLLVGKAIETAKDLRRCLQNIEGVRVYESQNCFMDVTKVTIDFSNLGLSGVQAEKMLRKEHLEVELINGNHVLVLVTLGDTGESVKALVEGVRKISDSFRGKGKGSLESSNKISLPIPQVQETPRAAYRKEVESILLQNAIGRVAAETIAFYPPGIPCVAMGEIITADVIRYIRSKQADGYEPNGAEDSSLTYIRVLR